MARAARLSGDIDEEEQEVEELMEEQRNAEHLVCDAVLFTGWLHFLAESKAIAAVLSQVD